MDDMPHQEVYFIGIALPPELDRQIAELKWRLHETNEVALKPLVPHVTLLNPPSLRGIMPSELLPKVREIASRYLPLTIALEEIGIFGQQVCYLRAESHSLYSLQSQLVKLLPPDVRAAHYKRPYTPHVTLLQVTEPNVLDIDKTRAIVAESISLPRQFTIDSVSCFTRIMPREYRPELI
ncbi:MAG: 2'-5' RNA ligase family protein [Candidatus Nomurabacteria bacterium]|nr:MAG: 2'-5' RNA ligase family protein [Candidatus Nomurabacteria bacterium]